jgi:hypothetical protein
MLPAKKSGSGKGTTAEDAGKEAPKKGKGAVRKTAAAKNEER